VPKHSAFEVELAIEKIKSHNHQVTDQIPAELIKAGGRTICYEIHKLITSIWNKQELPEAWGYIIVTLSIRRVKNKLVIIVEAYHFYQLHKKFYPTFCCQG